MVEQNKDKPSAYHHGNLKQALVDAYIELLEHNEPDKLSLRKLARHVGVAPTAVYNHFTDKEALTTAVCLRCLEHFADYLERHTPTEAPPEQRIGELGKAYFRYSVEHRSYFRIIMQNPMATERVTDEVVAAGMRAEAGMRNAVIALLEHHNLPATQYNEGLGAFACWAMAQGITNLAGVHVNRAACDNGRWPPEFMLNSDESVNQAFDALGQVLISGILASAKRG